MKKQLYRAIQHTLNTRKGTKNLQTNLLQSHQKPKYHQSILQHNKSNTSTNESDIFSKYYDKDGNFIAPSEDQLSKPLKPIETSTFTNDDDNEEQLSSTQHKNTLQDKLSQKSKIFKQLMGESQEEDFVSMRDMTEEQKKEYLSKQLDVFRDGTLYEKKFKYLDIGTNKDLLKRREQLEQQIEESSFALLKGGMPGGNSFVPNEGIFERNYDFVSLELLDENDESQGYKVRIGREYYLETLKFHPVKIPNITIASIIASEWEMQPEYIRQATMRFTELMCRVQDIRSDIETKNNLVKNLFEFFESETICHQEGILDYEELPELYKKHWDPIIEWFEKEYNSKLKVFREDSAESCIQIDALDAFKEQELPKLLDDDFALVVLHALSEAYGSVLCALSVFKGNTNYLDGYEAAKLEKNFYISRNGIFHGKDDVEKEDCLSMVSAGLSFNELSKESSLHNK